MIRVGIVDFDTSHVVAFTQRLNHVGGIAPEHQVEGARIVAGVPGTSAIMPERIPGYVDQMKSYEVPLYDNPSDLMGKVDAVIVSSQQGSVHVERATPFLEAGLPTFIDKPFAGNAQQADAIIAAAEKGRAPLMSCSALRYDPEVKTALSLRETQGNILSADVWSTAVLHDGNPGLLHYGVHGVEMLYTLLGTGCQKVRTFFEPGGEVVVGTWADGRIGTMRGLRDGQGGFGYAAHYEKGHHVATITGAVFYSEMLKRIVGMFSSGVPPIPYAEMREIMAFMDAAWESRQQNGAEVALSSPA